MHVREMFRLLKDKPICVDHAYIITQNYTMAYSALNGRCLVKFTGLRAPVQTSINVHHRQQFTSLSHPAIYK